MVFALPENLTRDQCVYLTKLIEQVKRYEEMVTFILKVVLSSTPFSKLTVEERNLLFVTYKNLIRSLRASRRVAYTIEQKEEARKNDDLVRLFLLSRILDPRSTPP
ncbi:14-3-3 protein 10-like [Prosopis cineraria]|uniref:14-3-3 protein 10-like n=1 Tax=Prosopis cineraria TaxID=364024 RepID=UPI00240F2FC7|nr:14-3-3 protein 10-like [Prosopis cineraria]